VSESDWPFLQIDFKDDFEKMHQECIKNDHLFVGHRQKDKHLSYSHDGWSALTLHGIRPDATENYDQYGLSEPNYKWTDACKYFPTCVEFLKKLGYKDYDRVRIMRLAPGGYIMPHSDGEGRIFGPLNIAINNPEGCNFYFKNWGRVPFKQGTGFFLDIGNIHAVHNNSNEPRYHFIVHGHINDRLIQTAFKQIDMREEKICYGVYNQRQSINSFSMYLRAKGATLFYLNRPRNNAEIICADEVHEILKEALIKGYRYCVIQSAGCTLRSFDYDREIRDFIKENNFGVAGHILAWPGKWLELHPQFFIVNVSAWKDVGCPEFGEWCSGKQLLPVVERSVENFHDDYTPLWVKYSKKQTIQSEAGRGWKLLKAMFLNNWPVITLSENIFKNKKLNNNGKVIVYDFNSKSLRWYKHFHGWKNDDLIDCIRSFSEKDHFTWIGKTDCNYVEDESFSNLYKELIDHFGGVNNFVKYWKIFKKTQVKFAMVDLYKDSEKFSNIFVGKGKKFVNLSNIFSTDATTFLYGHVEVQTSQQRCLASLYVVDPEIQISIFDFWGRNLVGKVKDIL